MKRILIIDDIPDFLQELRVLLKPQSSVSICGSPKRGVAQALKERPDIVITTLVMREMGGLEVIRHLRTNGFGGAIVLITKFGDDSTALEATRLGANDYITRPILPPELISRIERVGNDVRDTQNSPLASLQDSLCTADPQMLGLLELAQLAADAESSILIMGETGTGKELLARAVHRFSERVNLPFVVLNCAAVDANRLEVEFFGQGRGAAGGEAEARHGRAHDAAEGTLFIDQIAELPTALQAKLLVALQRGEYSRAGGNRVFKFSPRVIAATNRDMHLEVEEGRFRADLFFCLNVVSLTVPPLRERRTDILLLADFFFKRFGRPGRPMQRFSRSATELLMRYPWPGNVRELEHLVERSSILVSRSVVEIDDLPDQFRNKSAEPMHQGGKQGTFHEAKRRFEKAYFESVLAEADGNYAAAARNAGMERTAFYRKAKSALC